MGEGSLSYAFEFAEEEAHVRRLVVAVHLPYHSVAVLRVVQQCVDSVFCRDSGGVDSDCGVVGSAQNHLLAPVAENVGLHARGAFGVVVGLGAGESLDSAFAILINCARSVFPVLIVEGFVEEVAVPEYAEVLRHITG